MPTTHRPRRASAVAQALTALLTVAVLGLLAPAAAAADDPSPATPVATSHAATTATASPPAEQQALALPPRETWLADVTAVTDQASAYLADRLPDPAVRPAIVLDVDNTALQTQYALGRATPPVLALAQQASADGAAVFFVTSRPELLRYSTTRDLQRAGYPVDGLLMRGWFDFGSDERRKTRARISLEQRGYTIVANIGNSDSDLAGGHAERTFKLPDYDGRLI